MGLSIFLNKNNLFAGTTLRNSNTFEENNMGLHVAKNPNHIISNRKKVAEYINLPLQQFVCAKQTHSNHFHKVMLEDAGKGSMSMKDAIPDTDALYTYEPNIVLCSFTADCVPVLFYNETTGVIGAIHSGWQGTVKEITRKVLHQLIHKENNNPEHFHIILGPALSQEKFEVDEDVYKRFTRLGYADEFIYFNEETLKYHIDNQQTVKKQCELEGVPSNHILMDRTCTFQSTEHFSYRQDKQTGRHLSIIVKKSSS